MLTDRGNMLLKIMIHKVMNDKKKWVWYSEIFKVFESN